MLKDIDKRRKVIIPGDKKETLAYCAEHFIASANKAISDHGAFYVALSGGSTPKALFALLSDKPYLKQIDWNHVHLFWSDERCVDPGNSESNYKMAMDAGLGSIGIPQDQIHRMEGELAPCDAATAYEKKIHKILGSHKFDYVMLGMGDDGHTASLFPETKALKETDRLIYANEVPQKQTWRLTMTYPGIHRSKEIVFYVMGSSKTEMIQKVLGSDDLFPACRVGTEKTKALFILDKDAGAGL